MNTPLDHYYQFGDVYEALDAVQYLELAFQTLCRQKIVELPSCLQIKGQIADIRNEIESFLPDAG